MPDAFAPTEPAAAADAGALARLLHGSGARWRMALSFFTLAGLLFGLTGWLSGREAQREGERQAAVLLHQLAHAVADQLDADMQERQREVTRLADAGGLFDLAEDSERWRAALEQLQRSMPHYSWLGVTDETGRVRAATGGLLEGSDVSARPWYSAAQKAPAVLDLHEAKLLAPLLPPARDGNLQRFVDVAAPLQRNRRTVGVLGAHLSWDWAAERRDEALARLDPALGVEIVMLDAQQRVTLGPGTVRVPPAPVSDATSSAAPAIDRITGANGRAYLLARRGSTPNRTYAGMAWTVAVLQPADVAEAPARALRTRLWLLGAAGASVFGLLGWLLAGRLASGEQTRTLRSLNERLEALVQDRTQALAQANDDLNGFTRSVSHDLRGPLGQVALLLREAERQAGDRWLARERQHVALAARECERLANLTGELLALSQVQQAELQVQPLDSDALVAEALAEVRAAWPQARPAVTVTPLPPAAGDPVLLRQVWVNLIGNAFKYSSKAAQPQIHIEGERRGDEVVFSVRDNGAGFDPAQAGRLFATFSRLHAEHEFPGVGVGLTIVKRVVTRHGGHVWAEGQPGAGARFYFSLPALTPLPPPLRSGTGAPPPRSRSPAMIFRQLFEPLSSTYTYLLGCETTGQALLIDPVVNSLERDLAELQRLGLTLACTLDTHVHADHITGALHLKQRVGSRIAAAAADRLPCADIGLEDGVPLVVGSLNVRPLHTPGHTDHHLAFVVGERVFTGDALLIDGCGRTDFQNGSAADLYRSVNGRLFTLPDEQLVYPGHDYQGRHVSSIGQEKARNPRLGQGRTQAEFEAIMAALNLPYPKFIDHAVPGNRACGVCPDDLPEQLQAYCGRMTESPQG